jgi:hydroxyacyl-ACP dehydratase HTD2-like protein with hotdog domain
MPPGDFNQRMWASGNMKFPHGNPLCVGDNVKITNRVLKVGVVSDLQIHTLNPLKPKR